MDVDDTAQIVTFLGGAEGTGYMHENLKVMLLSQLRIAHKACNPPAWNQLNWPTVQSKAL